MSILTIWWGMERNQWLKPIRLRANLEQYFEDIASRPKKFILTGLNIGPEAIDDKVTLEAINELSSLTMKLTVQPQ
ncbi:hypothetical protein L4D76_19535 [Photobacterium sagamiensis]|uniref:hypothetical protein n=1 Tax=Photobacterium sagamiensis TaxID=2910241 RepID=UPI003D0B0E23